MLYRYEMSKEFSIDDNDHDYEEPYWEPANQEEELIAQLSKLKVPVVPVTAIEWVVDEQGCNI